MQMLPEKFEEFEGFPFCFSVLFGLSRQMVIASYLTTPDESFRKVWWDLAGEISPQGLEGSSKSLRRGHNLGVLS